jgi:uncharacterized protein YjbI with pentapeptide repeats
MNLTLDQTMEKSETTYKEGRWYQNDFVQTRFNKAGFDRLMALFNNMTDARVNGSTFDHSRWVGLRADGIDARPHVADHNLDNPEQPPKVTPTSFEGMQITKHGKLQKPEMWVRGLSRMRNALLQQSDWQGASADGLDMTRSNVDDANWQDTTWRGTVHNLQNFKRLRLRPKPGSFVRFEPSTVPPFRTPDGKKAEKLLKQWEQKSEAISKLSGKTKRDAIIKLGDKPPKPEDYCQFVKADLSGKNMAGVEIKGMRLNGAYTSYINLQKALVDNISVETILSNPRQYSNSVKKLALILKGLKFNKGQPPVLTPDKVIKAKDLTDNEAKGFKAKHQLAIQKSATQLQALLKSIQTLDILKGN